MELLRVWRRHLLGGAAVAVAVPVLILGAALAVGIAGGGLRGIGSLGQALTGPRLPDIRPVAVTGGGADDAPASDLLASALPAGGFPAPAAGSGAGGPGAGPGAGPGPAGPQTRPLPDPPGPAPTPAPTPAPPVATPTPTPPPRPVQQLGDQVTQVTDQVPVLGEPASQVIDVLVDTADGLLP